MAVYINPSSGQKYEVADTAADRAVNEHGLMPLDTFERGQQSGGLGNQLLDIGQEAVRQVASGAAGLARGVEQATASPEAVSQLEAETGSTVPDDAVGTPTDVKGADIVPSVYTPEALARREENPIATGIGAALPMAAAGLAAPLGLAPALGIDLLSGAAQEATDAEVAGQGITGEHILRNGALNMAFSAGAHILTPMARAALGGGTRNLLEEAGAELGGAKVTQAAGADGADLAAAVGDPTVRDALLKTIASKTDDAVKLADRAVEEVAGPRVAKNSGAQRQALDAMRASFEKSDPDLAGRIHDLIGESPANRYDGLRQLQLEADPAGETSQLFANVLQREDLWGASALTHYADVDAAQAMRPKPGAGTDEIRAYADALRKVRGGELGGYADSLEHLNDRASQLRLAPETGGVGAVEAVEKPVDYDSAMRQLTPQEAWNFKQGGGIEGTRAVAAHTVADAADRVTEGLRSDVAMSVKREDFSRGAVDWSPALIEKQTAEASRIFDRGSELMRQADASRGTMPASGYDWGGVAQDVKKLVGPALDRIAGLGDSLDDAVSRNYEIDLMKRGLDKISVAIDSSKMLESSKANALESVQSLANDLRKSLEDKGMWGQNGGLQQDINAGWKAAIDPWKRVQKQMSEYLGREFGKTGAESANLRRFDPNDIARAMGANYDKGLRNDLEKGIAGIDKLFEARQVWGLSKLDELASHRADLVRMTEAFKLNDILKIADNVAAEPLLDKVVGKVAGMAAHHLPFGRALGAVGDAAHASANELLGKGLLTPGSGSAFSRVMRKEFRQLGKENAPLLADPAFSRSSLSEPMQRQLMANSDAASERTVTLGAAAKKAAELDQQTTARFMVNPDVAERATRLLGDVTTPVARFQGDHDTLAQAFNAQRDVIKGFQQDPMKILNLLTDEFGQVADQSPALHAQMVTQAIKIQRFLGSKLPGQRNVSAAYPNGTPAGTAEMRTFAVYYTAALDPKSVMADARRGMLRQEQVEALQTLWPSEYAGLKMAVINEIASSRPSPVQRQRMSVLFGLGGSVDPALSAQITAMAAGARAMAASKKGKGGSAMTGRKSLPSKAGLTPGGQAALELGPSLD